MVVDSRSLSLNYQPTDRKLAAKATAVKRICRGNDDFLTSVSLSLPLAGVILCHWPSICIVCQIPTRGDNRSYCWLSTDYRSLPFESVRSWTTVGCQLLSPFVSFVPNSKRKGACTFDTSRTRSPSQCSCCQRRSQLSLNAAVAT